MGVFPDGDCSCALTGFDLKRRGVEHRSSRVDVRGPNFTGIGPPTFSSTKTVYSIAIS